MDKIILHTELDLPAILEAITQAADLTEDETVFASLAQVAHLKKSLAEAQEVVDEIESEVKRSINDRAKALYGPKWNAIKGRSYKITRSFTGPVYELVGDEVESKYVKTKITVDSDEVDTFVKDNSALPDGIAYNPNRGESLRITVFTDENDQA